jgi:peroxiredoxin
MTSKRIALLVAITLMFIASTTVPALALLPNGQLAPNFQLKDLSGTAHNLSDYRGKVVVIDFFGYACSACISDAKTNLVPLYNTYYKNDAKVQFLSVEVNGGSAAQIQQYLQQTGVAWLVLAGGGSLVSTYNLQSTPTLYVIDPAGNVALSSQYPTNVQTLKSTIDTLEGSAAPVLPAPGACAQGSNSINLFIQGTNNALLWKHWDGTTWSTWESLGGVLTSSPAAVSPSAGVIEVFVRGTNGALYERSTTNGGGSWGAWSKVGGQIAKGTGPAACSSGSGHLDVFVQGTTGALYANSYTGKWSGWQNLGGFLTSSPAAASPSAGVIDVFARGTTGSLYQLQWAGSSSGWISLGGQIAPSTGPAACSWGAGRLDVFVQGTTGALYHKWYTGSWSGWENLGGILTSSPAATSPASHMIDVFARGTTGNIYENTYANGWSGWTSIGGI